MKRILLLIIILVFAAAISCSIVEDPKYSKEKKVIISAPEAQEDKKEIIKEEVFEEIIKDDDYIKFSIIFYTAKKDEGIYDIAVALDLPLYKLLNQIRKDLGRTQIFAGEELTIYVNEAGQITKVESSVNR